MIETIGLKKSFGDVEVLRGVNLQVHPGEVIAIIGPSGSGKSTLLRCLNLLEEPTSGEIHSGELVLRFGEGKVKENAKRALRAKTAMVFQNFHLFPHQTALQNVMEAMVTVWKIPKEKARSKAIYLLGKVGLDKKQDAYPAQLSGGQQQRVAIARALAVEPEIMLLDEPTSALDPELVGEVLKTIRELANERQTMIIVTHEMNFAREVADRVIFMDEGLIIEEGKPHEVLESPTEERTRRFLGLIGR